MAPEHSALRKKREPKWCCWGTVVPFLVKRHENRSFKAKHPPTKKAIFSKRAPDFAAKKVKEIAPVLGNGAT